MKTKQWKIGLLVATVLSVGLLLTCGDIEAGGRSNNEEIFDGTVTGVTITSVTVAVKGQTLQLTAAVSGTGNYSRAVTWSSPEIEYYDTVSGTKINAATGLLTIALGEMVTEITVVATSKSDSTRKAEETIRIFSQSQLPTVTSVTVNPSSATVTAGGATEQFTATVAGTNSPTQNVTWSIVQMDRSPDTTISPSGAFKVAADEPYSLLTVRATSTIDLSKYGEAAVNVASMRVIISPAVPVALKGGTLQLNAIVGGSPSITWSIKDTDKNAGTTISSTGLLTVASAESKSSITVIAASDTLSAEVTVNLYSSGELPTVTSVTVSPSAPTVTAGYAQPFTATVVGTNSPAQNVTWSIVESNKNPGTTINENGTLFVSTAETLTSLTIRATSAVDTSKNGTTTVTVTPSSSGGRQPITTPFSSLTSTGGYKIAINTNTEYQEMHGFGASDCWSGNFVGQWGGASGEFPRFPYKQPSINLSWTPPGNWTNTDVQNVKNQIADWLFSQEFFSDGNPKGIGLSEWRVNLGAGSLEQALTGQNSKIGTVNRGNWSNSIGAWERMAECFLRDIDNPWQGPNGEGTAGKTRPSGNPTLYYDWTKQAGQQYWMREARKRGLEKLVAFSNSPPVPFTLSGTGNNAATNSNSPSGSDNTYSQITSTGNLKDADYASFAEYMADVANHFADPAQNVVDPYLGRPLSLRFNYISPVNEPQWGWNGDKQEGSPWSNGNIAKLVRAIDTALQSPSRRPFVDTSNTKQLITEAAQWDHLTGGSGGSGDKMNQIDAFYNPGRSTYVGNLASMKPWKMGGHTYWTHSNDSTAVSVRDAVKTAANARVHSDNSNLPVDIWSTEFCGLSGGSGLPNVNAYFDFALFTAKLAHQDITRANARTFSFWTALDMEDSGQSKFSLIAYAPGSTTYDHDAFKTSPLTRPGAIKSQATLWAMGHFSLFVRPNFRRIGIEIQDASNASAPNRLNYYGSTNTDYVSNVMATAYKSPPGYKDFVTGRNVDRVVVVYVNMASIDTKLLAVEINNGDKKPYDIRVFMTNVDNVNGGNQTTSSNESNKLGMRIQSPSSSSTAVNRGQGIYMIPRRSMVTVVYDFLPDTVTQ